MTLAAGPESWYSPPKIDRGGVCMAGSIVFEKDRGRYKVNWYHGSHKRTYAIRRYKGEYLYHPRVAQKLLARMQSDVEDGTYKAKRE